MAQQPPYAPRWVSVREAAELLGLTPDAVRKRFASGRLDGAVDDGVVKISVDAVEHQRAELLRRLNARDARAQVAQETAGASDLNALRDERDRLRGDLITARATAQALAQANAAALDMSRAQLDALQQMLTPSGIDG
jgi:hypothetical protein